MTREELTRELVGHIVGVLSSDSVVIHSIVDFMLERDKKIVDHGKQSPESREFALLNEDAIFEDLYHSTFLAAHFITDERAKDIIRGISKRICSKFGSPSVPSVEDIQRVIKEKFGEFASDLPTRAASFEIRRLLTNGKEEK